MLSISDGGAFFYSATATARLLHVGHRTRRARGLVAAVLTLLVAVGALVPAAHAAGEGEDVTLTGEVLDAACYVAHGRKGAGPGHRRCAEECVQKKNFPIGLLTEKEEMLLLVPDHADEKPYEQLKGYAAQQVTVTGKRINRAGLPAVIVTSVQKK
jgi:hypothetical protein